MKIYVKSNESLRTDSIRSDFNAFVHDINSYLYDDSAFSDTMQGASVHGDIVKSGSDVCVFEVEPDDFYAISDDSDVLVIEVESNGAFTAYRKSDDKVIAEGNSFDSIKHRCYRWIRDDVEKLFDMI